MIDPVFYYHVEKELKTAQSMFHVLCSVVIPDNHSSPD
jgi:hypothetical protein